jgi:hypothetical protein
MNVTQSALTLVWVGLRMLSVGDLATEYGFTDVDGRHLPALRME